MPELARPQVAVLLAAGRGSRLRPHTDSTPKPLLPWRGRATLDHIVDAIVESGIRDIVLVTHHLADKVNTWVERRLETDPCLSIRCVRQRELAGTADALEVVANELPEVLERGPFLLSATDYLVPSTFYSQLLAARDSAGLASAVSLKRLPIAELASRSSVRFASGRRSLARGHSEEILQVVEKPAVGEAPSEIGANLVFVLPPDILSHVRAVPVSLRGEREVQSALNAWIDTGGRCIGLVQETPMEWEPEPD